MWKQEWEPNAITKGCITQSGSAGRFGKVVSGKAKKAFAFARKWLPASFTIAFT
jgi:hypothetical protein